MSKIKLVALVLALVLVLPAVVTAAPQAGDTTIFGYVGLTIPVSVSIDYGQVINGIIDSGSSTTIFPESYIESLGYKPIGEQTFTDWNGKVIERNLYLVPSLMIQNNDGTMVPFVPPSQGPETYIAGGYDNIAIIGLNVLRNDRFTIDHDVWTLTIPNN